MMRFVAPFKLPTIRLQEKESQVSQHIPFAYLEEHDLVRTVQGDYMAVLKVEGLSDDTLEDEQLNFQHTLRSKLFSTLSEPRFAIYHTVIRSKVQAPFTGSDEIPVLQHLQQAYQNQFQTRPLFENGLYLAIVLKGGASKSNRVVSRIRHWFGQVSHSLNQAQVEMARQEAIKTLNEVVLRFVAALEPYKVRPLRKIHSKNGFFSEQLQFFSQILNWEADPILAVESNIASYLPKKRLFFGNKAIESQGNTDQDSRFAAMLSLKEYPDHTCPGMLDDLLRLPIEMVITQSFAFQHRQKSREDIELQLRRLRQSRDPDHKGAEQLQQALGSVVSGEIGFGYHHLTVMVLADDLIQLEKLVAEVTKRLSESGIVAVRERLNLEAAFWAQFPGNFRYIVRQMPITSANFASLCSLNNDPPGQKSGNHWGEAVALLRTRANLPFYFNFHPPGSDVGHSLILGMTGSGKTLLTCFLIASAMKYGTRVFYFDKDYGAEAFMRSMGASHSTPGVGISAGLNPLQLPDTPQNRRFLTSWLSSLVTAFGEKLDSEDMVLLQKAIRLNYEVLSFEQRTLANLAEALGRPGPGTLRSRLDQWQGDHALSEFFGASEDHLKLDGRCYCFEMGHLMKRGNQQALPSVLLYLFHRIELALEQNSSNTPTIICLDEAWALLDNPLFAEGIKNWLKTFRKRNAIVLLLSQELADITHSTVSASLNAETITKIFFPDPSPLQEVYRDIFHLSEREIHLLREHSVNKRYFLVKQPNQSAWVSLDLSHMKEWMKLLSGNQGTITMLHRLMAECGENPDNWLPRYLQEVNHA